VSLIGAGPEDSIDPVALILISDPINDVFLYLNIISPESIFPNFSTSNFFVVQSILE
jgi:hypothetical protein